MSVLLLSDLYKKIEKYDNENHEPFLLPNSANTFYTRKTNNEITLPKDLRHNKTQSSYRNGQTVKYDYKYSNTYEFENKIMRLSQPKKNTHFPITMVEWLELTNPLNHKRILKNTQNIHNFFGEFKIGRQIKRKKVDGKIESLFDGKRTFGNQVSVYSLPVLAYVDLNKAVDIMNFNYDSVKQ
eukprot:Pgem_evm1s6419